jgi:single-strand DNA-binding protein
MRGLNQVQLWGNLTRDPELRYVGANNTAVCDVGLAVTEGVKKGTQWEDQTQFFDVVVWGKTAEMVGERCRKGSRVHINGRLKVESWQDKQTNGTRTKVKIEAINVDFESDRQGGPPAAVNGYQANGGRPEFRGEEIPF